MRAKEFVEPQPNKDKTVAVTIPINITIPSGDKEVTVVQAEPQHVDNVEEPRDELGVEPTAVAPTRLPAESPSNDNVPDDEKVTMVPPLQQELEVDKASVGKQSSVIDTILDDPDSEEESSQPLSYR